MWKWAIIAGLIGYLILHPAVMVSGHLMMERDTPLSMEHVVVHEIKRSFSLSMLPWSIAFTLGAALLGGLYDRLKRVEKVLRDSRVRYQTVVDDQLDYICRFLPDGKCTFVNDALCRLIGRPRDTLLHQFLSEQSQFGELSKWPSQVRQLSPENRKTEIEQQLALSDGTTHWVRWIVIAIVDDAGRIVEYQSVGRDITAIKRAQHQMETRKEELERQIKRRTRALNKAVESLQEEIQERIALEKGIRDSEFKYRLLFESAPMGITLTTFDGRILAANSALLTMLKMDDDAVDAIDVRSLYAREEDRDRLMTQLQTDSFVDDAEVELRRLDGSRFHAGLSMTRFTLGGRDKILAVVNDISRRKKAVAALERSGANLRELSARLMTVQEEERKRIARELHDSVGQLMHAMKYALETALSQLKSSDDPGKVQATIEGLMPVLQEATAENRRIVMDLRPSLLDDLGLLATLNWFCREYDRTFSEIAVDKMIRVEESDIPPELRIVIYRIIQEAFNNTAKHSRARRVRLTLGKNTAGLVLAIEDDGVGFQEKYNRPDDQRPMGFGMTSMRERARATDGVFELSSTPGKGTAIRVLWPGEKVDRGAGA